MKATQHRMPLIRFLWATAVLASTIVLAAAPSQAANERESLERPVDVPPGTPGAVEYLVRTHELTLEEAERRINSEAVISELQVHVRATYPEKFAGLFVEHEEGGNVQLLFTEGGASAVAELRERFPQLDLTLGPQATLTEKELRAELDEVMTQRAALSLAAGGDIDAGIDIPTNSVVVRVPDPAAMGLQSLARSASPNVRIVEGTPPAPACSRNDCNPMSGGLELIVTSTNGQSNYCSAGFNVIHFDAQNDPDNPLDGVLTAGHCSDLFGRTFHGMDGVYNRDLGYVTKREYIDRLDASLIDYSVNPEVTTSRRVFKSQGLFQTINAAQLYDEAFIGQVLCKSGRTTFESCGPIFDLDGRPPYVHNGRNFIYHRACSQGGDSGAAVYAGSTAVAILSGTDPTRTCPDENDYSAVGHIEFVQRVLGVVVRTFE